VRKPLRVLIIEDSADDAELLVQEVRRGGYEPSYDVIASADDLSNALNKQEWDIILCDYTLPGFSGTQALSVTRSRGHDMPFIFVSGTIGEETAVAAMKAGAQDYVVKDNLRRLVPAIDRELREAETRRSHAAAESERRALEARFREVLATAPDAMVAVDADQRITIFNRAAETLFDYSVEEIKGQFLDLLLPPDTVAAHRRHIEEFAQSPDTSRNMNRRAAVRGRRKDGTEFPAEASISKLHANGDTTYMAVVRDISDRTRMLEALRQTHEMLNAIVQCSPVAIIGLDADKRVIVWNRSADAIFGYSAEEMIGQSCPAVPPEENDEFETLFQRATAGETLHDIESRRLRRDGTVADVRLSVAALFDAEKSVRGIVLAMEDVTEGKAVRRQLEHAQRMEAVGQLTGGLAHDFNNLLTVIVGNLELLESELQPDSKEQEAAATALTASLRGADLTRQLLAFARRQPLEAATFDLNELARRTMKLLRRTLGEHIEIELALEEDQLWQPLADAAQVESALANLAINARDAMPEGGTLTVTTANRHLEERSPSGARDIAAGEYVMIAVSDTGTGIAPDIRERVFDPFFSTKDHGEGTGLGLSMVYGFVTQSGGHLELESEIGQGTTIRLYLPKAPDTAVAEPQKNKTSAGTAAVEATILIVEDQEDVRRIVSRQLASLGYKVMEAANGMEAKDILDRGEQIDLLFTDVVMPGGLSGLELAIAALEKRPALKILFTSGYAEAADWQGMPLHDQGILLHKPYRLRDLAHTIAEVLGQGDE